MMNEKRIQQIVTEQLEAEILMADIRLDEISEKWHKYYPKFKICQAHITSVSIEDIIKCAGSMTNEFFALKELYNKAQAQKKD